MTTENETMKNELIRRILAAQDDPDDVEVKPAAYWTERIGRLSDADKALLAISPANRKVLNAVWNARRAAFAQTLGGANDNRPRLLAAAASDRRDSLHFRQMTDFRIQVEPDGPTGWLLILEILRDDTPPGVEIELYDARTGEVWLRGEPDFQGVISAIWYSDRHPRDAAPDFRLRVGGFDLDQD